MRSTPSRRSPDCWSSIRRDHRLVPSPDAALPVDVRAGSLGLTAASVLRSVSVGDGAEADADAGKQGVEVVEAGGAAPGFAAADLAAVAADGLGEFGLGEPGFAADALIRSPRGMWWSPGVGVDPHLLPDDDREGMGGPYCTTSGCILADVLRQVERISPAGDVAAYYIPDSLLLYIDDILIHGG